MRSDLVVKIYKVADEQITVYHITTQQNADNFLVNGFNPRNSRMFFAHKDYVGRWYKLLWEERKNTTEGWNRPPVILAITVSRSFFEENFIDKRGHFEIYYQDMPPTTVWDEAKNEWVDAEYNKPVLKNGVNCVVQIVDPREF